jgi:ABC-type microcin C transport system permease subunit YejE
MKNEQRPEGYWRVLARQFRRNRIAVAGLIIILVLFAVAAAADFLANDEPLVMKYDGTIYFPILKDYFVRLGMTQWPAQFQNIRFKDLAERNFKSGDWAQFPPIRYSPNEVSLANPLRRPSMQHFFGTDDIGRDIASRVACFAIRRLRCRFDIHPDRIGYRFDRRLLRRSLGHHRFAAD